MSQQYGGAKNPPWARSPSFLNSDMSLGQGGSIGSQQGLNMSLLSGQMSHNANVPQNQGSGSFGSGLSALGLSFGQQKSSMLHGSQPGLSMPTTLSAAQVGNVSYPNPRLMNQAGIQFQNTHQAIHPTPQQMHQQAQPTSPQQNQPKQRVFTGTVTKLLDNFGFVDEDVFFQTSAIKGSMPKVMERVLVEASYNPNMPFKWNANRIQLLPNQLNPSAGNRMGLQMGLPSSSSMSPNMGNSNSSINNTSSLNPFGNHNSANFMEGSSRQNMGGPNRRHSPPPPIPPPAIPRRERRGEERRERYRDYERYSPTPVKRDRVERPRSPPPKRPASHSPPRRRSGRPVPRYNVQIPKISLDLPDGNIVELRKRYNNLYVPSDFFSAGFLWQEAFPPHRPFGLDNPCSFHIMQKDVDSVVPNDATLEPSDVNHKFSAKVMLLCSPSLADIYQRACGSVGSEETEEKKEFEHPTRLITFLVGLKGKNETVAIGGPWSPSLDGPHPDKDPAVLIHTAIRTCKALTGIDLSRCTHWYRFAEIHYRRAESMYKGRLLPKRVETVVIFLPDIWSCVPTRLEWDQLATDYKKLLQQKLQVEVEEANEMQVDEEEVVSEVSSKKEPSHHSELDPKAMSVLELRAELEARGLNTRGLKSQLIARLGKTLKSESEKDTIAKEAAAKAEKEKEVEAEAIKHENDSVGDEKKKKEEEEKKLKVEKERATLEKRYQLPETPSIIVHPSSVAKGGKFDCTIMSLSVLLDYRQEDNKEHSFEVSLFAELFNEMLMRDFGFSIYKAMVDAPDVKEDEKDKKKSDKKDDKKDEKKVKKETEEELTEEEESIDDDDEDKNKTNDKKRKRKDKKPQMSTFDPHLLLSFVYFDQNHCGYILEKDLEEILYIIGLNLSRSQVRKLLQKVVKKESLHYRRLTDKPTLDAEVKEEVTTTKKKQSLEELAAGNKKFLPVFKTPTKETNENETKHSDSESEAEIVGNKEPLVVYKGALLDVEKLMQQLKRSEKARADTEGKMKEMQEELDEMHEAASISEQNAQKLSVELKSCSEKLKITEEDYRVTQTQVDKYQRALAMCRDQLHLLLGSVENSLEGAPTTFLTNSRKPLTYAIVTKSERSDEG